VTPKVSVVGNGGSQVATALMRPSSS
jgi:hypothetical protein